MSWRDRLQPGSFRGIPFYLEQASGTGGRRVAVHEYPQQEEHSAEDLGKSAGSERLRAFLVGADYDLQRDKLLDALDKKGPGILIHPYRGSQRVQILRREWTITTRRGGYCVITIEYVAAGQRQYPIASAANANALQDACNNAATAMQDSFSEQFSVEGQPAFVQNAAIDNLTAAADKLSALNGQLGSALQPVSDITGQIDQLTSEVATLVLQPRTLATTLFNVITATLGGVNEVINAFKGYEAMLGLGGSVPNTTPSRKRQAMNQTASNNLLLGLATVETARFIARSRTPFTTYDQAMTTRDRILLQIDALIETGTDAEYTALADLQTALIRRVDDVAPGLQRVEQIRLQQSLPALALAHKLYGDATRADELVQRNSVSHPGFMPAGSDLEVLS